MKKQLLIAAVAASMTSVAMADVSISGAYLGKIAQSAGGASFAQDLDLKIVAKSGDTTVTTTVENLGTTFGTAKSLEATTVKLSTKLEGISFSAGNYKSFKGNGLVNKPSASEQYSLGTSVAGVGVSVTTKSGEGEQSLTLKGDVAGFGVKIQNASRSDRYVSVKGNVAGVAVDVEKSMATGGLQAVKIAGTVGGMSVSYANINCKTAGACTESRSTAAYGALNTSVKVKGLIVSTGTTMGKVTFKNIDKDGTDTNVVALQRGNVAYKYSKTSGSAKTLSATVKFKF
jgi:hypothetical protein